MFGKPDDVQTYSSGRSTLSYRSTRSGLSNAVLGHLRSMVPSIMGQQAAGMAMGQKTKSFTVDIDANGIMSKYLLSE